MTNCRSCGSPVPEGQNELCSMCMGDIGYGTDGYYEDWAKQQLEQEEQQRYYEEQQRQDEEVS